VDSVPYKVVPIQAALVETDNVGQVYVCGQGVVHKYSLKGEMLQKNSALALGPITGIDATNALKVQLFFGELSQITYLDNLLAARGENLSLDLNGFVQSTAVCRSYNDGVWLYDQTTLELVLITQQFERTAQSGNLAQILGHSPHINYIREANNLLYAHATDVGVLVFDWYGSYVKTIPLTGGNKFNVFGETLYYVSNNNLQMHYLPTAGFKEIKLPAVEIKDFAVFENILVLLTPNELRFYRLSFK
jgi:hypothetical protein